MANNPKIQYPTLELIARLGLDYFRGSVLSLLAQADTNPDAFNQAETLCLQAYELCHPISPSLSNNFTNYELELYTSSNNLGHLLDSLKSLMGNDWALTLIKIRKLRK